MILNKTTAILLFITLNMQRAASSSPGDTLGPSLSKKPAPLVRKQRPAPKNVLKDGEGTVKDVEVQGGSSGEVETLKGHESSMGNTAPPVNQVTTLASLLQRFITWKNKREAEKFARLIKGKKYDEITKLGEEMNNEKFLKQLCSVVKTPEQYKGVAGYLNRHNLVASFYVCGNIFVVNEAIIAESSICKNLWYDHVGGLETALPLALKEGHHDRFIELLEVRKGVTVEVDEQLKRERNETSFERFLYEFLRKLAPWEDGMAFKRFLTTRGDELRDKHPDIFYILCERLMRTLKSQLANSKVEKFLIDLMGQPSLLTPAPFVRGFLYGAIARERFPFIDYAWSEAMEMGLKSERLGGGKYLWQAMQEKLPTQFSGDFPDTDEAIAAVLVHFPTKQKLEDDWNKKYAVILFNKVKSLGFTLDFLPDVLWTIIFGYVILWTDI